VKNQNLSGNKSDMGKIKNPLGWERSFFRVSSLAYPNLLVKKKAMLLWVGTVIQEKNKN